MGEQSTLNMSRNMWVLLMVVFLTWVTSKTITDCSSDCYNPFEGSDFSHWCFVPCSSSCGDVTSMSGFFAGKCKSASACGSNPVPDIDKKSGGACECLDPEKTSCPTFGKCYCQCDSGCLDQSKNKDGKCLTAQACA